MDATSRVTVFQETYSWYRWPWSQLAPGLLRSNPYQCELATWRDDAAARLVNLELVDGVPSLRS